MIQVKLESGITQLTCWLDTDKPVRKHDRITLKDSSEPDRLWEVLQIYKDLEPPARGWKVGGLG